MQVGAQDFLLKGENDAHLLGKTIRYAIERKRTERRLLQLAHYDSLTGLANRALFHDHLCRAVARTDRQDGILGLLFIDLDHFKSINDTLGHDAGDELLCHVASRIEQLIRAGDVAARLGGDEFTVIIEDIEAISKNGFAMRNFAPASVAFLRISEVDSVVIKPNVTSMFSALSASSSSIPVLQKAKAVTIAVAGRENGVGPKSTQLAQYLNFWGIKPKIERTGSRSPDEQLLEAYRDTDSDLMGMGAYSRSRFRQLLFGGVTDYMLRRAEISVLMLHS